MLRYDIAITTVWDKRRQLSQTDRVMLHFIEQFAISLKVIENHSKCVA